MESHYLAQTMNQGITLGTQKMQTASAVRHTQFSHKSMHILCQPLQYARLTSTRKLLVTRQREGREKKKVIDTLVTELCAFHYSCSKNNHTQ